MKKVCVKWLVFMQSSSFDRVSLSGCSKSLINTVSQRYNKREVYQQDQVFGWNYQQQGFWCFAHETENRYIFGSWWYCILWLESWCYASYKEVF